MEKEKFNIHLAPGMEKAEIIIRELKEENDLKVKAPVRVSLIGTIGSPLEFLRKRLDQPTQIDQKRCHVFVSRQKLRIVLITNEHNEYERGSIVGILSQHPKFIEFGINSDKTWEPIQLGQFFKMNRYFFADRQENLELVTALKNFEAIVNSSIEKQKEESGSFKDNYSGAVTSNLPGKFKLKMPLFKGGEAEMIEVEFYASVNGRTVTLQLYSPEANQALEDIRDKIINEQIEAISLLAPDIAIIEE